jgi:hypothetical protein
MNAIEMAKEKMLGSIRVTPFLIPKIFDRITSSCFFINDWQRPHVFGHILVEIYLNICNFFHFNALEATVGQR